MSSFFFFFLEELFEAGVDFLPAFPELTIVFSSSMLLLFPMTSCASASARSGVSATLALAGAVFLELCNAQQGRTEVSERDLPLLSLHVLPKTVCEVPKKRPRVWNLPLEPSRRTCTKTHLSLGKTLHAFTSTILNKRDNTLKR